MKLMNLILLLQDMEKLYAKENPDIVILPYEGIQDLDVENLQVIDRGYGAKIRLNGSDPLK